MKHLGRHFNFISAFEVPPGIMPDQVTFKYQIFIDLTLMC